MYKEKWMTDRIFITIVLIIFMSASSIDAGQDIDIQITSPHDQAEVDRPAIINGTVSGLHAKVHLVVHPADVPEYWVQPRATVSETGKWTSKVYLGRPENNHPNKYYEIMAVANPGLLLKEGDVLKTWPSARGQSQIIHVKRRLTSFIESSSAHEKVRKGVSSETLDGKGTYYIQVGLWRNKNFADEIVTKLKKRYPRTYMVIANDLNKIIIPDIRNYAQGRRIVSEIESDYHVKPLLKLKKK
jgi:hypothetical protein